MFSLNDAYKNITLEEIYSKVEEYQLWKYYCTNFREYDISFKSELYNDKNPSCRIKPISNGRLQYTDFGTGDKYGIFDYIQAKYSVTFKESLNIVSNDFNLRSKVPIVIDNTKEQLNTIVLNNKPKTRIEIISQPFNITDYNYWSQYDIPLTLLEKYNVYSCKHAFLIKGDKTIRFDYDKNNPIYAYKFINENNISYKLYKPYEREKKYKWMFSGGSQADIEGLDQLRLSSNILVLTKSLKDCICFRMLNIDAIALQGETNRLDNDLVIKLLKRFDKIIINYDLDDEGIKNTLRLNKQYGFSYFYIDKYKDLAEYIKQEGLKEAKIMINKRING